MAITDNSFTTAELEAVLEAKPELKDAVKGVLTSSKFNFVVQTPDEHNTFKNNYETSIVSRKTQEYATQLEADVFQMTGIDKKANEKYYDYFKRATAEKLATVTQLQTELTALRSAPNQSAADKQRIAHLEQGLLTEKEAAKKLVEAKDKELVNTKAEFILEKELAAFRLRYKKTIPEDVLKLVEKEAVTKLLATSKFADDGSLTFVDDKGVLVQNAEYKPKAAKEFFDELLKSVLEETKSATGAGAGGSGGGAAGGETKGKFTTVPSNVKTKNDLTSHLFSLGYTDDDPEFTKILGEHGKGLPLR